MLFLENNIAFNGVPYKEIPTIMGEGAPTETTEGAVGCLYMNINDGKLYKRALTMVSQSKHPIFSGQDCSVFNGYFSGVSLANGPNMRIVYLPIVGGHTYTINKPVATTYFYIYGTVDEPNVAGVQHDAASYVLNSGDVLTVTRTMDAKANWLAIYCYNANKDTGISFEDVLNSITIIDNSAEITEPVEQMVWLPVIEPTTPIYYEIENDIIKVVSKYNETQDICMQLQKKGANNLFDFYTAYKIENDKGFVSEHTNGVEFYKNTTDFHAPFRIKAQNNADGDNAAIDFTGGNHAYDGGATGTPTARTTSLEFWVDNRKISNGEGDFSGNANIIEIRWSNNVQATNTKKADGTGREVLTEKHTLVFDGYEWTSHVEVIPLEDIYCDTWYGLQCSLNSQTTAGIPSGVVYSGVYKFIGGTNREAIDLTASNIPITQSGDNSTIGMMAEKDGNAVSMILDPTYDLGRRTMYTGDSGVFFNKKTMKTYFTIISGQLLKENCSYFLKGKYKFFGI